MDFLSINKTKNEEKQTGINSNADQGVQENVNRNINAPDRHTNVQRANDLNPDTFAVVTEDMCIDYTKRDRVIDSVGSSLQSTKNLLGRLKRQRVSDMFNIRIDELYEDFTGKISEAKKRNNNGTLDFASCNELIKAAKTTNEKLAKLLNKVIADLQGRQKITGAPTAALVELKGLRDKLARRIEINYEEIASVPLEQILATKTDKDEKRVRENLITLGNALESQMSILLKQNAKESSGLFRNCCDSVVEFRALLRSGKLDVAKQHDFMPVLTKMRTAVAAYFDENSGSKFSSKGRERKRMAKDILKSIDDFILRSPEYVQLSFADEMESTDANIDALEYSSTQTLYKKLAEKTYKKDNPGEDPGKLATADSYRVYAAAYANAEISNNVKQALDESNLPDAVRTELARQCGSLFGEIRKNHDGSYASEEMQERANGLRQVSEQIKAGNYAGMDAIFSAHVKKVINTRNSIDKFNYEYVTKHFREIFFNQAGIDFENMFYKKGTMGGRWFMNQPRELQDRLRAMTYAGAGLDYAINGPMLSQNISLQNLEYKSAYNIPPVIKKSYELAKFIVQKGAAFVYNNMNHVTDTFADEIVEPTYFDGKTTYEVSDRNMIEYLLMQVLYMITDPEQMDELKENEADSKEVKRKKKEKRTRMIKEYQRYKKASEEMRDVPVFGDNVLDYLHRKHKNPLITEQSMAIMKKVYKHSDPAQHYKYSRDTEIAGLYDAANERAKKAKGGGADFDRQLGNVFKPVEYDLAGAPISEVDRENEEWNLNYMRAYATGNISDRIPYYDELLAELEYYGEHPEIFDEDHVLEHIEEFRRASRVSLVLLDNIFKDPINKQYFDSFSEEKKNYLNAVNSYIVNKSQIGLAKLNELGITVDFTYATMPNGYNDGEAAAMKLFRNMAKEEGEKEERAHGAEAGENSLAALREKARNAEQERKLRAEAENNIKAIESLKLLSDEDKANGAVGSEATNSINEEIMMLFRKEVEDSTTLPADLRIVLGLLAVPPADVDRVKETRKVNEIIAAYRTVGDMMNDEKLISDNGSEAFNAFRNPCYSIPGEDIGNMNHFYKAVMANPEQFGVVADEAAKEGDLKLSQVKEFGRLLNIYIYRIFIQSSYHTYIRDDHKKKLMEGTSDNADFMRYQRVLAEQFDRMDEDQNMDTYAMFTALNGLMDQIKSHSSYKAAEGDKIFRKPKVLSTDRRSIADLYDSSMRMQLEDKEYGEIMKPDKADEAAVKSKIAADLNAALIGDAAKKIKEFSMLATKEDFERIKNVLRMERAGKVPAEGTEAYDEYRKLMAIVSNEPGYIYGNVKSYEIVTLLAAKDDIKKRLTDSMKKRNERILAEYSEGIASHRKLLNDALDSLDRMLS